MATRVTGRSGGKGVWGLKALAGFSALVGAGLVGCTEEDPNARALSEASIQLRTISPGSVPPTNDEFATQRHRIVAGKLKPVTTGGTKSQQSIAAILNAEVEVGLARPALTRLAEIEHEIGSKLTRMMSIETARVSAQQTAEALGGYDPSPERSTIDQRGSELQQGLSTAEESLQALEQRVDGLGSQISNLEGQVATIRREESALRDRALVEDPITAAETISQARDTGRRADGFEVEMSTMDAQSSVLGPQIEALGIRIKAINAQLAILSEARENVARQSRQSADDASAAESLAREFSAELVTRATEIGGLHQSEAQAAMDEARQAFERATSSARRASTGGGSSGVAIDGTLASAGASRSLGDLLARRAGSLEQTAGTFRGLAGRAEGEQGRRLTALADQLSQLADGLKQDAIAAYEQAASNFRRVRALGTTRDALRTVGDDLDRAIERLGGRVAGSDDPMDLDRSEVAPGVDAEETTGEIAGELGG